MDLNNAKDFARATLSTASTVLNTLTGLSGTDWDIEESAYGHPQDPINGSYVVFHVFKDNSQDFEGAVSKVTDTGGRKKVPIIFPYVDGQTTDDLGRMGSGWEFDVLIFGENYRKQVKDLIKEFNDPRAGTLIHPVFGRVKAAAKDWTITHDSEKVKAAAIRVHFIEHNFDISFGESEEDRPSTLKSGLLAATRFFGLIDSFLTKIESNLITVRNLKASVKAAIVTYQASFQSTLVQINTTFNDGTTEDIPGLLPTTTDEFATGVAYDDPFQSVPSEQLQNSTIAALNVQQAVDNVNKARDDLNAALAQIALIPDGELIFYEDILNMKDSAISLQNALEMGIQSSNARVKDYIAPRLMTVREVCYANGLSPDRSGELEILNPNLESLNYIPMNTAVVVPTV